MQHMVTTVSPTSYLYCFSLVRHDERPSYILRSRSIHISIHRNTICSTTSLVFQLSHLFRSRHDQRRLSHFCLQTQTARWYVHLIISPFSLHNLCYFLLQNATYSNASFEFPACLSQAGEIIPTEKDPTDSTSGDERMGSSKEVLSTPAVHLLAFFMLFYYGVEMTMGGTL